MRRASLAAALVCVWPHVAGAAESWTEVKSPNFRVVTNVGEGRARDMAWELEQARAAFAKLWPWARLAEGKAVVVVVAKDEATLKRWAPKSNRTLQSIGSDSCQVDPSHGTGPWRAAGGLHPGCIPTSAFRITY
jgi:hypothetical protein